MIQQPCQRSRHAIHLWQEVLCDDRHSQLPPLAVRWVAAGVDVSSHRDGFASESGGRDWIATVRWSWLA